MFEKLKAFVGDNAEALKLIESLETSTTQNVETINKLERTNGDLLGEVKKFKEGNSLVKSVLGIEQLNEDTIKEALGNKKGGDEKLVADIANYKKVIDDLNGTLLNTSKEYESKLSDMALTNAIRDLGIGGLASSPVTEKLILEQLKAGATLDGGKIVYKNEDGTTVFNGSNIMTPTEKLNTLKSNKDYAPLFKADVLAGGGKPPQGGGDNAPNIQNLSSTELMKQGRK